MNQLRNLAATIAIATGATLFAGCAPLTDGGYGGGYNQPYGSGYGHDDYYYERERRRLRDERRDAERERDRAEEERRRLEEERRRLEEARRQPPPPVVRESCPSGFRPSERRCSDAERKRGCRDLRTPGGLGCVSR